MTSSSDDDAVVEILDRHLSAGRVLADQQWRLCPVVLDDLRDARLLHPHLRAATSRVPMVNLSKCDIRGIAATYGVPDHVRLRKASGCAHKGLAEEEWGFTEDELDFMCDTAPSLLSDAADTCSPDGMRKFRSLVAQSAHKRVFYPSFEKPEGN